MNDRAGIDAARAVLAHAIDERVVPAVVAEVGDEGGVLWREALGSLSFDEGAGPATDDAVFDLASLTKPLATTSVILALSDRSALDLREPVATFFEEWRGADREAATVQDLLEHGSGLPARLVDPPPRSRREFEHEICRLALECPPRAQSIYSDLGFILLGFIAADRGRRPLDAQFGAILPDLGDQILGFDVRRIPRDRIAPTTPMAEDMRRGRRLVGEVHDNYAAALGGHAGHAGLFGTAGGVGAYARMVLRGARGDQSLPAPFSPTILRGAITKSSVPGSSRALGWDTMLPTSSCGTRMSPAAFGHTGFTGTSLWIDPARNRYFVLLTNRVCGDGTLDQIQNVRRAFHDALATF